MFRMSGALLLAMRVDARVFGLELIDEVRAVHALAQEPFLRVGAVLADDDVQRDALIRSGSLGGGGFGGGSLGGGSFGGGRRSGLLAAGGQSEDHDRGEKKR